MMTPDEMIAVIQAYKEGADIESRNNGRRIGETEWFDNHEPHFNFEDCDYRVKPRTVFILEYKDGNRFVYDTQENAEASWNSRGARISEWKEVLK